MFIYCRKLPLCTNLVEFLTYEIKKVVKTFTLQQDQLCGERQQHASMQERPQSPGKHRFISERCDPKDDIAGKDPKEKFLVIREENRNCPQRQ